MIELIFVLLLVAIGGGLIMGFLYGFGAVVRAVHEFTPAGRAERALMKAHPPDFRDAIDK